VMTGHDVPPIREAVGLLIAAVGSEAGRRQVTAADVLRGVDLFAQVGVPPIVCGLPLAVP